MRRHKVEPSTTPAEEKPGLGTIEYLNVLDALDELERSEGKRDWIVDGVIEDNPIVMFIGPEKRWKSGSSSDPGPHDHTALDPTKSPIICSRAVRASSRERPSTTTWPTRKALARTDPELYEQLRREKYA